MTGGPRFLDVQPLDLRILACCTRVVERWSGDDMRAPYWRLYWNPAPGAWLNTDQGRVEIGPDCRVLIAPETSFTGHSAGAFTHTFMHASVGPAFRPAGGGVFVQPLADQPAAAMRRLSEEIGDSPGCTPALALHIQRYLIECLQQVPDTAWPTPVGDARVRAALEVLQSNLVRPPGNAQLAAYVGLHPGSLVRRFTAEVGMSPQRFALCARLDRAAHDLTHTDLTVAAIAEVWGFSDRQHLTRTMRRYYRMTPGAWRQRSR